jgi:hypothetical protein
MAYGRDSYINRIRQTIELAINILMAYGRDSYINRIRQTVELAINILMAYGRDSYINGIRQRQLSLPLSHTAETVEQFVSLLSLYRIRPHVSLSLPQHTASNGS